MLDFLLILILAILGLLAHVARTRRWLEWILRSIIVLVAVYEALSVFGTGIDTVLAQWSNFVISCGLTISLVSLFIPFRKLLSWLLTGIELMVSGQIFLPRVRKHLKDIEYLKQQRIFVPSSFPHLMSLFIYIHTAAYLLLCIDPEALKMPYLPLPIPLEISQLLSYNGIGLIILSACGVGIWITRPYKDVLSRLGLVKPSKKQIGIGILLIIASFAYDAIWSLYTHNLGGQDLATKLSFYNSGTFSVMGGVVPSVILALATALCAGIGEETLIRGALQPVFGILPSAILHGLLHGQYAHAPVFIIQVAIWSVCMGIVRRYTHTTTTIIGHAGFNFVTTFLFAFNP